MVTLRVPRTVPIDAADKAPPLERGSARLHPSRALLVSELFPPAVGGSAVLFHGIYSRLERTDVVVLTDPQTSPHDGTANQGRVRVLRRPIATQRWGVMDPRALWHHARVAIHIRSLLRRGAGLVHVARALPEGLAALLARTTGGPDYVCWTHGEDLATAQSSRELTFLTRRVYAGAKAALANSRNTASMLEALGIEREKICVVYPAVDAVRFHPAIDGSVIRRRYARHDDILLLSVGRLQRRKGHDVTIAAMHRLRTAFPHVRYLIAGDGDERRRLEGLVHQFGLHDRIFFAGVVPNAELPAHYTACDVFVLPNRVDGGDIEGFGIVFLEAAAAGRPVIGGDSGGVPEAVVRDRTGLLVDGSDIAQVSDAIARLAASAVLRERLGRAGRARVEEFFTWERAAAAVSVLHARLARGGRDSS